MGFGGGVWGWIMWVRLCVEVVAADILLGGGWGGRGRGKGSGI